MNIRKNHWCDLPETVVAVYLFGSKARGDSTSESDIDYKLSIIVIPEERFSFMKENKYSFAENVLNEGVAV